MKNILVINLTRFGDQLQSQAAINVLAEPDTGEQCRIGLVCLPNFASSANLLNNLHLVRPLPKDSFLSRLEKNWPEAAAALWQWREELWRDFKPDMVCNLTPTVPGRLLGRFLAGEAPLTGFGLNELGFGVNSSWAAFFQGSSRRRSVCPFNLADLFRAVAGRSRGRTGDMRLRMPSGGLSAALEVVLDEGARRAGEETRGFAAFQLGASEERRRWPAEYFAALGDGLWRHKRLLPLLLGSAEESRLAVDYAAASKSPSLDLTGRTSLEDLALLMGRVRLLVSNDTGTMHLAAGLGLPVLGIFLATAQVWDTGPCLPGCCSLEPGLACHPCSFGTECRHSLRCRWAIPPAKALELCLGFLETGRWPETKQPERGEEEQSDQEKERPRVWLSFLDEFFFMNLRSLSGHEHALRTLWFREQRLFLRQFLDRDPQKPFVYAPPQEKSLLPPQEKALLSAEISDLLAQLGLLLELGRMLRVNPLPRIRESFISAIRKLSTAFDRSPRLISLGLLWQTELQEQGDELEKAMLCIEQYHSLISSLLQRVSQ
ncbi:MAG: glycosyltransferase family 9 protein [Deltaproteobacteria bacterium]|nr:glycosyltransferase family 9 protein [Deltaproteobacteria bacterium]